MPNKALRCPTCKTLVTATAADPDFPFCSDRCRRIDLGKWASGDYRITSPVLDPDLLEDLEREQNRGRDRGGDDY
jgi:endogenous inhibitor of DNA gyrase (YacG/DUF329 family)